MLIYLKRYIVYGGKYKVKASKSSLFINRLSAYKNLILFDCSTFFHIKIKKIELINYL